MFKFLVESKTTKIMVLSGLVFPAVVRAENARADFNSVTCVDISDPGANGDHPFVVSLIRKSKDRQNPHYDTFDVIVKKQMSLGSPDTYETVGHYTAKGWEYPNTQEPYYFQFDTGSVRQFELGLYRTNSLPWADLWMVTNSGSNRNEEMTKQLECSLRK